MIGYHFTLPGLGAGIRVPEILNSFLMKFAYKLFRAILPLQRQIMDGEHYNKELQ